MVRNQARSNRKPSGGRYKKQLVRRQHEIGREPAHTRIAPLKHKAVRTLGGNHKHKALSADTIQLAKDGKHEEAEIESVIENPANRHFIRRNIITKGALLQTSKGKARVTNRPGQDGHVQGVPTDE